MRLSWSAVLVVTLVGCTKHNPESCSQGTCTDPALPFCDVDGSIGGEPLTCVAVTCTAGESAGCRGDVELKCNGTGNNYDLVDCPSGCNVDTGVCRTCTSNEQCTNPSPVCDAAGECRACESDDECASTVCDGGSCMAESNIIYAKSGGSESSDCLHAQPCSISRAVSVAAAGANARTIRMLPGNYVTSIDVSASASAPLRIVATGATVTSFTGIRVGGGANVEIRGISATGANNAATCGAGNMPRSRLSLRDAVLLAGTSSASLLSASNCDAELVNVELAINDSTGSCVSLGTEAAFVGDRLLAHGQQQTAFGAFGQAISFKLTNSILVNPLILFTTGDTQGPGTTLQFAFNTIHLGATPIDCSWSAQYRMEQYEDNIIYGPTLSAAVEGSHCNFTRNVILPQPSGLAGNIVADPQFEDAASGNYHLKTGSPALDAALSAPTIFTDHDFDGTARPHGTGPDIGAYEQ